jgi:hypothetical protein
MTNPLSMSRDNDSLVSDSDILKRNEIDRIGGNDPLYSDANSHKEINILASSPHNRCHS